MASSVSCGAPWLCDGPTYDGLLLRTQHVAASFFNTGSAQVRGGVMPSGGQMAVSAGGGMTVNVATGYALCPSSSGSTFGGYLFSLMTAANLTVSTSDPTNPRVDLVCAFVNDLGTSSSAAYLEILTGTPTAGATLSNLAGAPSLPSNGIVLGYVLVPAGSSSVTSGNILNSSSLTVAQGGILPVAAGSAPTGYTGSYIHDTGSGSLKHNPASGPAQAKVLPFTPQQARQTSGAGAITGTVTVLSLTVTTDGNTDLEIIAKWPRLYIPATNPYLYGAEMIIEIDSTPVCAEYVNAGGNGGGGQALGGGGTMHHVTMSGVDRPSSGTHTVTWQMAVSGDGTHLVSILAATGSPATLYARAAPL